MEVVENRLHPEPWSYHFKNTSQINRSDFRLSREILGHYLSPYSLTRRELDILYAISYYGDSNEELGVRLKISPHTVKNHISKILVKMKIRSIREAQAFLLRSFIRFNH